MIYSALYRVSQNWYDIRKRVILAWNLREQLILSESKLNLQKVAKINCFFALERDVKIENR